jgi:hypothetical protein
LPSTETIRSPGLSDAAAGLLGTISPTVCVTLSAFRATTKRIRKASAMLTAGPAPITTIRFQTGCW